MPGEPGDLLDGHSGVAQRGDEGVPQLPRRPAVPDPAPVQTPSNFCRTSPRPARRRAGWRTPARCPPPSPAASRSPAWPRAQAHNAWTAAAGRARVRRDFSVLVSPWDRTDRHTAACAGTGGLAAGLPPSPRVAQRKARPLRCGGRSPGTGRYRRASARCAGGRLSGRAAGPITGRVLAAVITATAWSRDRLLVGRPVCPLGVSTSRATLRATRSRASACRITRASARCPIVTAALEYPAAIAASAWCTSPAVSSRSCRAPMAVRIGARTFWFFLTVLAERPSSPWASQSSAARRTVVCVAGLGGDALVELQVQVAELVHDGGLGRAADLAPLAFPSPVYPRVISPRHRPGQCRWRC